MEEDKRNNLPTNAYGLSQCIGKFLRCSVNHLSVDFIRPAGIVAQRLGDFNEVFVAGNSERLAVVPCFDGGESGGV